MYTKTICPSLYLPTCVVAVSSQLPLFESGTGLHLRSLQWGRESIMKRYNCVTPILYSGRYITWHRDVMLYVWVDLVHKHTLCLRKKLPPLNSLQLCQILTDFQNFCTSGKLVKFATKAHNITHLTLGMLLHYLGISNIQIFCKYSADMWKCKQIEFLVHRF